MAEDPRTPDTSARDQALCNRLVLSRIFSGIADNDNDDHYACHATLTRVGHKYSSFCLIKRDLLQCCLVSRSWFYDAVRELWRVLDHKDCVTNPMVTDVLSAISDPDRKQFYANNIEICVDHTRDSGKVNDLGDTKLPKLREQRLIIKGGHIPSICAPALRSLIIDPESEHCSPIEYGFGQGEMQTVFKSLPSLYPNLESIVFVDRIRVHHGAIEKLTEQLPRLKRFDHDLVYVTKRQIIHEWRSHTEDDEDAESSLEDDDSQPYEDYLSE